MSEVRITDPKTGGEKGQKPERYDLLPFDALDELARVYGVGARKYADDNWLRGYSWRLSLGALMRHVARFMCGESRDPETGCHHLAHAAWHCLTVITFEARGLGTDDRRPPVRLLAAKPAPLEPEIRALVRMTHRTRNGQIASVVAIAETGSCLLRFLDGGELWSTPDHFELVTPLTESGGP